LAGWWLALGDIVTAIALAVRLAPISDLETIQDLELEALPTAVRRVAQEQAPKSSRFRFAPGLLPSRAHSGSHDWKTFRPGISPEPASASRIF
jgi:hypothetical protein